MNKKTKRTLRLALILALLCTALPVSADEGENANLYRLDLRVTELKNGSTASEREYVLLVRADTDAQIRTGNRVPVTTADKLEYLSVGLHIDCHLSEQGDKIRVNISSEINSFVLPQQAEGDFDEPPVIRAISSRVDTAVTPGKPTTVSTIDDVMSDSRYVLVVTATKVD